MVYLPSPWSASWLPYILAATLSVNGSILNSPAELSLCKGLKIVQLNCCSIITKIDEIRSTLVADNGIHILCITETWFKPYHSSDSFEIPNYVLVRLDLTRLSLNGSYIHGGGVACYLRDDIIFSELKHSFSGLDIELLTLSLSLQDQRTYFLCITYRPPSGNYHVALSRSSEVINFIRE